MPQRATPPNVAAELVRAARVLHDDIGPLLAAAGLRLRPDCMDSPESEGEIREIQRILGLAMENVARSQPGTEADRASSRQAACRAQPAPQILTTQNPLQLFDSVMPLNVLFVDDHKIMRDGIRAILARDGGFNIIGEAESGTDALQVVKRLRPDMVLMDIGLPGLNGLETTIEILRYHPACKIVILSMYDDENSVVNGFRAGARAFILKKASDQDLLEALKMVAQGGMYLSPQVSDRLLNRIQRGDPSPNHLRR